MEAIRAGRIGGDEAVERTYDEQGLSGVCYLINTFRDDPELAQHVFDETGCVGGSQRM